MRRSHTELSGFTRSTTPVASPRLLRAVAASLMLAACLGVVLTLLSIKVSMAMPILG